MTKSEIKERVREAGKWDAFLLERARLKAEGLPARDAAEQAAESVLEDAEAERTRETLRALRRIVRPVRRAFNQENGKAANAEPDSPEAAFFLHLAETDRMRLVCFAKVLCDVIEALRERDKKH